MGGNLNNSLFYRGLILGFGDCDADGPLADSRFCEMSLNRREDAVIWGKNILDWTRDAIVEHLKVSDAKFQVSPGGDVSVSSLSLELCFDHLSRLEYVATWAPANDRVELN